MWSARNSGDAGTAKRRRERRLRQFLRHERLTVAMLLAETNHHAAPRGQSKARSKEEVRIARHDHDPEQPPPQPELFQLYEEEPGGFRPPCLGEPRGPQDQDQQRTVEQPADYAPMVHILDAPVAQMVEQLPDIMRFFDTLSPVPEQVIEVHKIFPDDVPMRTTVRDTQQLAEQLVEVPTIVSFSALLWIVERQDDIPVPGVGGRFAGLQVFPSEQRLVPSKSSISLLVEVSKVSSQDRVRGLRTRSLIFPFLVEVFKVFATTTLAQVVATRGPA